MLDGARRAFQDGISWASDLMTLRVDGSPRTRMFTAVPTFDADLKVSGVVLYAHDISGKGPTSV